MSDRQTMEARIDAIGRSIRVLIGRLADAGYVFEHPDDVFPGPDPDAEAAIARMEREAGALPPALKLFWLRVGSVDLMGAHPDWMDTEECPDPLVVFPPAVAVDCLDQHLDDPELGPFEVVIAPDSLHKANVSGGAPYSVSIPALADDPPMNGTSRDETFLEHIEYALAWGGFPGLSDCVDHDWPLARLAEGLASA